MNSVSLPKLELLQVLRALAALAVVFFHTYYQPGYGAYGVSVFFVLSGVIMAMLFEAHETPFQFMLRRCIRIVPLYWVTTSILTILLLLRTNGELPLPIDYFKSLFFIPYAQASGGIQPILGPGWTLNYELAFYLSCFLGLLLSVSYPATSTIILVIFWNGLAGMSSSIVGNFYHNSLVYYFIAGIGIWKIGRITTWRFKSTGILFLIPIFCLSISYLEYFAGSKAQTDRVFLLKIVLINLVVFLGLFSEPAFQKLNAKIRTFLVSIGDASYAIYLTHLFVIYLFSYIGKIIGLKKDSLFLALVSIIFATFFGCVVHRYFDAPIQKRLKRLIPQN